MGGVVDADFDGGAVGGGEVEVDVVVGGLVGGGVVIEVEFDLGEFEGGEVAEVFGDEGADACGAVEDDGVVALLVFDFALVVFGGFLRGGAFGEFLGLFEFGEGFGGVPAGEEGGVVSGFEGRDKGFGEGLDFRGDGRVVVGAEGREGQNREGREEGAFHRLSRKRQGRVEGKRRFGHVMRGVGVKKLGSWLVR